MSEKFLSTLEKEINKEEIASFSSGEKSKYKQLDNDKSHIFSTLKEEFLKDQKGELVESFENKFNIKDVIKQLTGDWEDIVGENGKFNSIKNEMISKGKLPKGTSSSELVALIQMYMKYSGKPLEFFISQYDISYISTKNIKVTGKMEDIFNLIKASNMESKSIQNISTININGKETVSKMAKLELASEKEILSYKLQDLTNSVSKFKGYKPKLSMKLIGRSQNNIRLLLFQSIKKIQRLKTYIINNQKNPENIYKNLQFIQKQSRLLQNRINTIKSNKRLSHTFDAKNIKPPYGLNKDDRNTFCTLDIELNKLERSLSTLQRKNIDEFKERELNKLPKKEKLEAKENEKLFNITKDIIEKYALHSGKNVNINRVRDILYDPKYKYEERVDKVFDLFKLSKRGDEKDLRDKITNSLSNDKSLSFNERHINILLAFRDTVDSEKGEAEKIIGDDLDSIIINTERPDSKLKNNLTAFKEIFDKEENVKDMVLKFMAISESPEENGFNIFSNFCNEKGLNIKSDNLKSIYDNITESMENMKVKLKSELLSRNINKEIPSIIYATSMVGFFLSSGIDGIAEDNVKDIDNFSKLGDYRGKAMELYSDMTGIGGGMLNLSDKNKGIAIMVGELALDMVLSILTSGANRVRRLGKLSKFPKIYKKMRLVMKTISKNKLITKGNSLLSKLGERGRSIVGGLTEETIKQNFGNLFNEGYGKNGILPSRTAGLIVGKLSSVSKYIPKVSKKILGNKFKIRLGKVREEIGEFVENSLAFQTGGEIGNLTSTDGKEKQKENDTNKNFIVIDNADNDIISKKIEQKFGKHGSLEFASPPGGRQRNQAIITKVVENINKKGLLDKVINGKSYEISYPKENGSLNVKALT